MHEVVAGEQENLLNSGVVLRRLTRSAKASSEAASACRAGQARSGLRPAWGSSTW